MAKVASKMNKKVIVYTILILLALVVGAFAFISSDYWQSIKDSSASGSCIKYATKCETSKKGRVTCKRVCEKTATDPRYLGPAERVE